ncbi:conserved hypothetical protein [Acidovorax delafieldii 2AN]|uniref:Lipid A deacylase n=1 Tax=Acidovorax delafieldii 2AN TaxID=573060 RepID=C5T7X1_ACIDE|nr:acyloxyacyl hydrolase [Acidovorax delafieldii]EER59421.1 conserved hypothetical protein [Acidovorax delafieldii 2AN]
MLHCPGWPSRPRTPVDLIQCVALLLCCASLGIAHADEPQAPSLYLEAGHTLRSDTGTHLRTLGLRLPLQHTFWQGRISTHLDMYLSDWASKAAPPAGGHTTQVGVVPMFRYRFDEGRSRWFVEGGIGLSYLNGTYHAASGSFSSRWNFSDHIGVGRNFGTRQHHEVSLHAKHVSNAGLRKPNPGETFLQLRYGYRF